MATKNNRNARVIVGGTAVNKSYGAKIKPATKYSQDTSHGDTNESYIPGILDGAFEITSWYQSTYHTLVDAALDKTVLTNVLAYPDYSETTHYWYCPTMYCSMEEHDLDLGNTSGHSFVLRPAGGAAIDWIHP